MVVICNGRIVILVQHVVVNQLLYRILCQIWVDGTGSISQQCGKVMYLPWFPGLQNHCQRSTLFRLNQMLLQCRHRQQRRNGHMILVYPAV